MRKSKVNRSYTLKLYGTKTKFDDLEWSAYQYSKFVNAFSQHLYFNNVKHFSTEGLGVIGNQAQQKALGMVKSKKTNEKENGHKKSAPNFKALECFAHIDKQSSSSHYNYKIKFSLSFAGERAKPRYLFSKGIKPLKKNFKEWLEIVKPM